MAVGAALRIVPGSGSRASARRLADAVESLGVDPSVPTFAKVRPSDWVTVGRRWSVAGDPAAVFADSEHGRTAIETTRPDLVGRVWVATPGKEQLVARTVLDRLHPRVDAPSTVVGVIGYDQKFFRPIADHLRRIDGVDVLAAEWPKYAVMDEAATNDVIDRSSVLVAEWCGPNAVYASRNKRVDQRLVVRLHRFELEREDWRQVDIEAVDLVVTVGPHYRRRVLERTGWPAEKVTVIPNPVDLVQFDRPKLDGARETLGLLGAIPWRKRPDRALEILDRLDGGWRLEIKSDRPERHRWMWEDADHRKRYERLFDRIDSRPDVVWEDASSTVAQWFRRVGVILSTSEDESFHLAPAEGMASGTVPVIWDWPGAEYVYPHDHIVETVEEAVAKARTPVSPDLIRREVAPYDLATVLAEWRRVLLGV